MSTKIYGAFKVDKQLTFWGSKEIVADIKDKLEPYMILHMKKFIVDTALNLHLAYRDISDVEKEGSRVEPCDWLFFSDGLIRSTELKSVFSKDKNLSFKDIVKEIRFNLVFICKDANKSIYAFDEKASNNAHIKFYPMEDKTLFTVYAPFYGFSDELRATYDDYEYQNSTDDIPEGVTPEQWQRRSDDWDLVTNQDNQRMVYKADLFDESDVFGRIEFFESDKDFLKKKFDSFVVQSALGEHINEMFAGSKDDGVLSKVMKVDKQLRKDYREGKREVVKIVADFEEKFLSFEEFSSEIIDAFTLRGRN